MRACTSCPGFVPDHLTTCPHCGVGGRWQRVIKVLAGLAGSAGALVTLAACYGAPPYIDTCVDQDSDGWLPGCYNDDLSCDPDDLNCDCRDYDPAIHPGAFDPIDGVDRDCDGKDPQGPLGEIVDAGPDAWPWADAAPIEADATPPDGSVP